MKHTPPKSAISLISYDAHLLPGSIKTYYPFVDEIILGLDEDRKSWSNNSFSFDEDILWSELKQLDVDNKITIIEDNFHKSNNPLKNDTDERMFLKEQCSYDWIFSFDADEYLVNPKDFFLEFFPLVSSRTDVELLFTWFMPYKEFDGVTLMITDENRNHLVKNEQQGFACNKNHIYHYCRWSSAEKKILAPLAILHYSFCRTEKELTQKINNWSHSQDMKQTNLVAVQKEVSLNNYKELRNFKPVENLKYSPHQWPTLRAIPNNELWSFCREEARLIYA